MGKVKIPQRYISEQQWINNNLDMEMAYIYTGSSKENNAKLDNWSIFLLNIVTNESVIIPFFTGVELRYIPPNTKNYKKGTVAYTEWVDKYAKPVVPTPFEVLGILLFDMPILDYDFEDYCQIRGFNPDSIDDLECYIQQRKQAKQLSKIFKTPQWIKYQELFKNGL